jgi:cis-3-alkyl-4-acyloxetan-2-one decarboxylase
MRKLYPFTDRFLTLDGLRYHYWDEGHGEPVVMLHGNPTWCFYYRKLVTALCHSHRCLVPDHIGCGLSEKPDESRYEFTLRRRVDDVEHWLDQLGVKENITLIVHDWGGMIGMTYATRHPERIKRLVILNTAAFHLPKTKRFPWVLWLAGKSPLGELLVRGLNAFCLGAAFTCTVKPLPSNIRRAYLAPYDSWANRLAVHRFVQDIPLVPTDPAYPVVSETESRLHLLQDKPMLLCWGMKDFIFDQHFLAEWKQRFPHADVHTFPHAGHYLLEDAGEEVAGLVREFIEK